MAMLDIDPSETENILDAPDDSEEYIFVHYRFVSGPGSTIKEGAIRVAIMTSLKTLKPVFYESPDTRRLYSAKVVEVNELSGEAVIAYPLSLCTTEEGITQLLMVIFTGCEYSYTERFWIEKIDFPKEFLSRFRGPKFGIDGLRDHLGIFSRPLVGAVVKPRNGFQLEKLIEILHEALIGGADIIVDDVLLVDPEGSMAFIKRLPKLAQLVRDVSAETGENKHYICNISSSLKRAMNMAKIAKSEGASGLVVNAFTMGYSTIQELSEETDINLPLITSNFGIGMLTHPGLPHNTRVYPNGVSEGVMAFLGRLVGADAAHVGTSGTDCAAKDAWGPAVNSLRSKVVGIKPCFSVAEGDLTIADIWANVYSLGTDFILETCTGIFNYPGGPANGAYAFRKIIDELNFQLHPSEAHNRIMDLARADSVIKAGLDFYDYKPLESVV